MFVVSAGFAKTTVLTRLTAIRLFALQTCWQLAAHLHEPSAESVDQIVEFGEVIGVHRRSRRPS